MKKAVVIFSGGQDSTTCLGWAINKFDKVVALSFNYGQNHSIELQQAKHIVDALGVEHYEINIDFFGELVDSALTHNEDVSKNHSRIKHLPASFVPNRNAVFITLAHSYAQKIGAESLITGVCETDYSGYPDCRQSFISSIEQTLNLASDANIRILTPLMKLNKSQTFQLAKDTRILDLVIEETHTCYNGNRSQRFDWGYGCGECPACILRAKGYENFINGDLK